MPNNIFLISYKIDKCHIIKISRPVTVTVVNTQRLKMSKEQNTSMDQGLVSRCNIKQNPKITILVAASALAVLIIGFSILALVLRDKNENLRDGKKFLESKTCPVET